MDILKIRRALRYHFKKYNKICPMDVDVTDNSRKRKNGTECILCFECKRNCPKGAL